MGGEDLRRKPGVLPTNRDARKYNTTSQIRLTIYEIIMAGIKNSFVGAIAGWILSLFGKGPGKPTSDDLSKAEFKTSTQRMGVRFSERIRDVFRFKWLRRH